MTGYVCAEVDSQDAVQEMCVKVSYLKLRSEKKKETVNV